LRPGRRPFAKLITLSMLPTVIGLLLRAAIALDGNGITPRILGWNLAGTIAEILEEIGPALSFGVLGTVLIVIFVIRLRRSLEKLPVSLPPDSIVHLCTEKWPRVALLIWFYVTCMWAASGLVSLAFSGPYAWALRARGQAGADAISQIVSIICLLGIVCVSALAVGDGNFGIARKFLRLPPLTYDILGTVICAAVGAYSPLMNFVADRISWANRGYVLSPPPQFASYFQISFGKIVSTYLVAALAEEFVWRGYLQPIFVERYGLARGLVLLGICWGASHFQTDFGPSYTNLRVLTGLSVRLAHCTAFGLVLGWLVLKSGSIWPSVLGHTIYNGVVIQTASFSSWDGICRTVLLGFVAYQLYRRWPIAGTTSEIPTGTLPDALPTAPS
jgi:membrane protease YdiL (CAAX protease family)